MLFLDILSSSCPLLLCAMGALFSDFAGILAVFLEGLITFSAYLMYFYSDICNSAILGFALTLISSTIIIFFFSLIIERFHANPFISATAINLFLSALPSFFSSITYGTRGVLYNQNFVFNVLQTKIITVAVTLIFMISAILFLRKTRFGLYIRITGSDSNVLVAKGVTPLYCRIAAWCTAAFFASASGCFLALRVSSFVPNISSGRGWMALAAVYLGRKNPIKIITAVVIFCGADLFSANIQNYTQAIPNYVLLALPYLVCLLMVMLDTPEQNQDRK